jgi:hypothetical protein
MTQLVHQIDLHYAALPDVQIEAMWRHALRHDPDALEPLLRQLVLRATVVLDRTCRDEGARQGLLEADIERAIDESAVRLLSRLRVDAQVRDVRAIANQIAREVVADPLRRRAQRTARFTVAARPRLRLIRNEDSQ